MEERKTWWQRGSNVFPGYSNKEVVLVHLFIIGLLLVCGIAEGIGG